MDQSLKGFSPSFVCGMCGKCFADAEQCQLHIHTHTGQQPFRCIICWPLFYDLLDSSRVESIPIFSHIASDCPIGTSTPGVKSVASEFVPMPLAGAGDNFATSCSETSFLENPHLTVAASLLGSPFKKKSQTISLVPLSQSENTVDELSSAYQENSFAVASSEEDSLRITTSLPEVFTRPTSVNTSHREDDASNGSVLVHNACTSSSGGLKEPQSAAEIDRFDPQSEAVVNRIILNELETSFHFAESPFNSEVNAQMENGLAQQCNPTDHGLGASGGLNQTRNDLDISISEGELNISSKYLQDKNTIKENHTGTDILPVAFSGASEQDSSHSNTTKRSFVERGRRKKGRPKKLFTVVQTPSDTVDKLHQEAAILNDHIYSSLSKGKISRKPKSISVSVIHQDYSSKDVHQVNEYIQESQINLSCIVQNKKVSSEENGNASAKDSPVCFKGVIDFLKNCQLKSLSGSKGKSDHTSEQTIPDLTSSLSAQGEKEKSPVQIFSSAENDALCKLTKTNKDNSLMPPDPQETLEERSEHHDKTLIDAKNASVQNQNDCVESKGKHLSSGPSKRKRKNIIKAATDEKEMDAAAVCSISKERKSSSRILTMDLVSGEFSVQVEDTLGNLNEPSINEKESWDIHSQTVSNSLKQQEKIQKDISQAYSNDAKSVMHSAVETGILLNTAPAMTLLAEIAANVSPVSFSDPSNITKYGTDMTSTPASTASVEASHSVSSVIKNKTRSPSSTDLITSKDISSDKDKVLIKVPVTSVSQSFLAVPLKNSKQTVLMVIENDSTKEVESVDMRNTSQEIIVQNTIQAPISLSSVDTVPLKSPLKKNPFVSLARIEDPALKMLQAGKKLDIDLNKSLKQSPLKVNALFESCKSPVQVRHSDSAEDSGKKKLNGITTCDSEQTDPYFNESFSAKKDPSSSPALHVSDSSRHEIASTGKASRNLCKVEKQSPRKLPQQCLPNDGICKVQKSSALHKSKRQSPRQKAHAECEQPRIDNSNQETEDCKNAETSEKSDNYQGSKGAKNTKPDIEEAVQIRDSGTVKLSINKSRQLKEIVEIENTQIKELDQINDLQRCEALMHRSEGTVSLENSEWDENSTNQNKVVQIKQMEEMCTGLVSSQQGLYKPSNSELDLKISFDSKKCKGKSDTVHAMEGIKELSVGKYMVVYPENDFNLNDSFTSAQKQRKRPVLCHSDSNSDTEEEHANSFSREPVDENIDMMCPAVDHREHKRNKSVMVRFKPTLSSSSPKPESEDGLKMLDFPDEYMSQSRGENDKTFVPPRIINGESFQVTPKKKKTEDDAMSLQMVSDKIVFKAEVDSQLLEMSSTQDSCLKASSVAVMKSHMVTKTTSRKKTDSKYRNRRQIKLVDLKKQNIPALSHQTLIPETNQIFTPNVAESVKRPENKRKSVLQLYSSKAEENRTAKLVKTIAANVLSEISSSATNGQIYNDVKDSERVNNEVRVRNEAATVPQGNSVCVKSGRYNHGKISKRSVKFKKYSDNISHKKNHGKDRFPCDICGNTYGRRESLKTHRMIHTGEAAVNCHICGKTLSTLASLVTHMRIHTGERPYSCPLCPKNFRQQSALTSHYRVHTKDRPFKCNICNKAYRFHKNLYNHKFTHTGERRHECSICKASFYQVSALNVHLKIHSGERPFACNYCSMRFVQKAHLAKHVRHIHTERIQINKKHGAKNASKPYKCVSCGGGFTSLFSKRRHLKYFCTGVPSHPT